MSEPLSMWTVYDHPTDYPEGYLARRFEVTAEGATPMLDCIAGPSLDAVRQHLIHHAGMSAALARSPDDHPNVLETWI